MGLKETAGKIKESVANVYQAMSDPKEAASRIANEMSGDGLEKQLDKAQGFVDHNVEKLKSEAWTMVNELEKRLDSKLDQLEQRLDERLQKELYWKLMALRWTLIFVLLAALAGIGYTLIQRYLL